MRKGHHQTDDVSRSNKLLGRLSVCHYTAKLRPLTLLYVGLKHKCKLIFRRLIVSNLKRSQTRKEVKQEKKSNNHKKRSQSCNKINEVNKTGVVN